MYDVISVGSAILDVFIKSPDLQLLKTKEVFTGEAIMVPYGAKCEVEKLVIASGGGGTNTAVGFSRLGLKAAVLARCGWDYAGKMVRREIIKEGVGDDLLIQAENEETDYSTILIGPDGRSTIFVYRGVNRLDLAAIDFEKLKTGWFCISGLEGNIELLEKLIGFAAKKNIKVAVNPGRREIERGSELISVIKNVDALVVNQEEASRLTQTDFFDPKLFTKTALISKGIVVVTKGAGGAYLYNQDDRLLTSDGFEVEMVDSVGAGDGFTCGFIAGLVRGWDLEKALKLGIANGASVVTEIGAKTGLIVEENISNWLEKPLKMGWRK